MSHRQGHEDPGLSEQELQGQEAHDLPHREVMSLLAGGSSPVPLPATSALPGMDAQAVDAGAYAGAGGSSLGDMPLTNTADTNTVQTTTTTTATDSATS